MELFGSGGKQFKISESDITSLLEPESKKFKVQTGSYDTTQIGGVIIMVIGKCLT